MIGWDRIEYSVKAYFFAFQVYTPDVKGFASGASGCMGYLVGFSANKSFHFLQEKLSLPGTFWLYGAVALSGTVLLYFYLPETEGHPLHEILVREMQWNKMRFLNLYVLSINIITLWPAGTFQRRARVAREGESKESREVGSRQLRHGTLGNGISAVIRSHYQDMRQASDIFYLKFSNSSPNFG